MTRRRKSRPEARFIALPHYMLNSAAFMSLPGDAVKILIDIWKRHNGGNNGEISYGVREAEEIDITKSTASRMMTILEKRGFIAVVRHSHFGLKNRLARTWRLTAEPYRGEQGTKDFMRWKPNQPAGKPASWSHQWDLVKEILGRSGGNHGPTGGTRVTKLPVSVPPVGPSEVKSTAPQSHQWDTYTVTRCGADRCVPPVHPLPRCPRLPDCVLLELAGET
jgi:hypothetical protein